jgi:hypothetical protein
VRRPVDLLARRRVIGNRAGAEVNAGLAAMIAEAFAIRNQARTLDNPRLENGLARPGDRSRPTPRGFASLVLRTATYRRHLDVLDLRPEREGRRNNK